MPEEYVEYIKTPGFAVLEGNKITDAQLGEPTEWTANHILIRDMLIEPSSLIGKYYDPDERKAYLNYDCRSGAYDNLVPVSHEDDKAVAVKDAGDAIEVLACNWMIRFIDQAISYGKPITAEIVPSYVNVQLIKYLGKSKYEETGE